MKWIDASDAVRQRTAFLIASEKNISEGAVEKDWWVTAILKVLFKLTPANYMFFKGGTSLSKGWNLIDRFSEDIDIALYRDFYYNELGKSCARAQTNNQIKNLRICNRDYILGDFSVELEKELNKAGLGICKVVPIRTKPDGSPIDHDRDPAVIEIHYPLRVKTDAYVRPIIKIEVSCLSMKEPYEVKTISSLVGEAFPKYDDETVAEIPTVSPSRTFLEKAFLLNEEYQRHVPRTKRMSRHLYDLERLMDTPFASAALADRELYMAIIEHRRRFYRVKGVLYELNNPETISFCPKEEIYNLMRKDYEEMKTSMIYGDKITFKKMIERLELLQQRFRQAGRL